MFEGCDRTAACGPGRRPLAAGWRAGTTGTEDIRIDWITIDNPA